MDKSKISAIASIIISAAIALAALWGYNIVVVQPLAEQVAANTADLYGTEAQGGSRAVGDTNLTNLVTSGDATVGGNLNVTGTAAITGGYTTGESTVYEGATADAYETTLAVADPTADRTITLPNLSGYVQLSSNPGRIVMGQNTITGTLTISHGITTPQAVFCDLAADAVANAATCSAVVSGSTVTVKVWKADGVTAASVPVLVDWLVGGQP
jgi:hypothetical protein